MQIERLVETLAPEKVEAAKARLLAAAASVGHIGEPTEFLDAIRQLDTNPKLMRDIAPEFRNVVIDALEQA